MSVITATIPSRAAQRGRSSSAPLGAAAALIGVRLALMVVVQALVAALAIGLGLAGPGRAINASAHWWMAYSAIVELCTLAGVLWLVRRSRISYRELLGPATPVWQVALGAVAIVAISVPSAFFSLEVTAAMFGSETPPALAIVDKPPVASAFAVIVWPPLIEVAEPVAYLGLLLPALERRIGTWAAVTAVIAIWAAEHALLPITLAGGSLDLAFAAHRVISVVPFLAVWMGAYLALGRRVLPLMAARWFFNAGAAAGVALGLV
jgi:hypothetical protein